MIDEEEKIGLEGGDWIVRRKGDELMIVDTKAVATS